MADPRLLEQIQSGQKRRLVPTAECPDAGRSAQVGARLPEPDGGVMIGDQRVQGR